MSRADSIGSNGEIPKVKTPNQAGVPEQIASSPVIGKSQKTDTDIFTKANQAAGDIVADTQKDPVEVAKKLFSNVAQTGSLGAAVVKFAGDYLLKRVKEDKTTPQIAQASLKDLAGIDKPTDL